MLDIVSRWPGYGSPSDNMTEENASRMRHGVADAARANPDKPGMASTASGAAAVRRNWRRSNGLRDFGAIALMGVVK